MTYKIKKRKEFPSAIGFTWFEIFCGDKCIRSYKIEFLSECKRIVKERNEGIYITPFPHGSL